jgi:hypothetical protein
VENLRFDLAMIENGECDTRLVAAPALKSMTGIALWHGPLDRLQHTRYLRFFTPTV